MVLLEFERGDRQRPKGHAILYFLVRGPEAEQVTATYLVVPPVALNMAKYMPPLLAANVPLQEMQNVAAVPLPPIPETVPSRFFIEQLAEARDDDILFGGELDPQNEQGALQTVGEVAQAYHSLWADFAATLEKEPPVSERDLGPFLYSMMSERERLGELAKLMGTLRYHVEGHMAPLVAETTDQIRALAQHLPAKYATEELLRAASLPGEQGSRLSQLYMRRCYLLCDEDYRGLEQVEQQIKELRSQLNLGTS
jgi:hypothetical protein